jgi:Rrf2 family protein
VISQTAEYALRAVVDLAYNFGQPRTTQQIAQGTRVPTGYLAKILQDLAKAGLVRSQRGPHGGFALAHDPSTLTVFDVLRAVDPPRRILTCPLGLAAHAQRLCPLHKKLDDAMAATERAFRKTTIADVTASPSHQPLRDSPARLTVSAGLALAPPDSGRKGRG